MCGLAGTINLPLDRAALDLIAHRGPDGSGLTEHPVGAHRVRFGHRRLSIVELTGAGSQPMATPDGRHVLIFNGEIYNHLDLRDALGPVAFRGHSDTETLLHALATWGTAAAGRLNGIFAFAFLDIPAARLILARDPFGVKPLYWSPQGGGLCFASELRPLLTWIRGQVDRQALATLLRLRYSPSPDTLFRGVYKLRPGHLLDIDLGRPDLPVREVPFAGPVRGPDGHGPSLAEATRRYGGYFTEAVERQLMSDVEVGVLLSGGVDSALVAAAAQRRSSRPLKAFTVGFTGAAAAGVDETADARQTADVLGMEHHVVRIGEAEFLDTLRTACRIVEEPLATTSMVPMTHLCALAASKVKVVLSGQGADEILGGYGRYQGELYRRYLPAPAARAAQAVAGRVGVTSERLTRGFAAYGEADEIARFIGTWAVFGEDEIQALTGERPLAVREHVARTAAWTGAAALPTPVARLMALDARLGLADDLLLYTDKISMHHSLECRVPLLDHELVRFVEGLPADYRVTLRETKRIHKAWARTALPAAVIDRPKKGFWSPTRAWFRESDAVSSLLLAPGTPFAGLLDPVAVRRTLDEHRRGLNRERHIFLLLGLYYWAEGVSA